MWNARRILKELADPPLRRRILTAFWKHEEAPTRAAAQARLAKAMRFREQTLKKMPAEKKADLLAMRAADRDLEPFLERALVHYFTHESGPMVGAFLDRWGIPHENGVIGDDEVKAPEAEAVRAAADELAATYPPAEVDLYLAAAGLVMGDDWRAATWPVVDRRVGAAAG